MAYIIWDIEKEHVRTTLDWDPSVENPDYLTRHKVFEGDINLDENLLCCYVLNAAGDGVENPYAGKTKAEQDVLPVSYTHLTLPTILLV